MLTIKPLTRDTATSTKITNFNMARFQKWSKDVEMVYDYAVFVDIHDYDGKKYCDYLSLYNEQEFEISASDEHEDSEELLDMAIDNAYNGIITYAKIAITANDNWICELYTDKEIKGLITEEQYKYLENAFKNSLNALIENKKVEEVLRREMDRLKDDYRRVTVTIGKWSISTSLYNLGMNRNTFLNIMEKEYNNYKVEFPITAFVNMTIKGAGEP